MTTPTAMATWGVRHQGGRVLSEQAVFRYRQVVQISKDGFKVYPEAVDLAFGPNSKFETIVKEYRNAKIWTSGGTAPCGLHEVCARTSSKPPPRWAMQRIASRHRPAARGAAY